MERKKSTEEKIISELANYKKYCKCGHSVIMLPTTKRTRVVCNWCGRTIYKNDFEEFKDKLSKILKRRKASDSYKS